MDKESEIPEDPIENNDVEQDPTNSESQGDIGAIGDSETNIPEVGLEQKVKDAYTKNEDFQNRYLRAMADIENLKRRQIKEREEAVVRTRSQIISDLLPVLDAFQMGMIEVEKVESTKNIFVGISMAFKQMENVLGEYGLEIINPTGAEFDPKFHEALSYVDNEDIEEGHIVQTVRFGYKMKDKLLRPASVIISQVKEIEGN
jgi:molecular chaperone GrpE